MPSKNCVICGKPSGIYPLCKHHLEMKSEGKVVKDNNGNWVEKYSNYYDDDYYDDDDDYLDEEENEVCVLCGSPTNYGYLFCKDCFKNRVKETRYNFNHNRSEQKIRDQYFVIRNLVKNGKQSRDEWENNIVLMYALAEELDAIYYDDYLIERVEDDILDLLEDKPQTNDSTFNFNDEDYRKKWPAEHQCDDGHYVRSYSEMLIDNWLYNNHYVHAYEKSVYMPSNPDAVVLSDFYLPEGDVYIEFWGLEDDERYAKRKQEKINLYDENGYNRIDLNESHIKRLNDILPRELAKFIKSKRKN